MSLPHLTSLYNLYLTESQPFRKVHRMVDLFESVIKTYTAVMMAEYFRRDEVSDRVKGLLANGLRTPSLGIWQVFSRELYRELKSANHTFTLPQFAGSFESMDKALELPETNAITFRNTYAHGGTPPDEQCLKDISRYAPFLKRLLSEGWIAGSGISIQEGKVHLHYEDAPLLCLHPILVERPEPAGPSLAFFNDIKKNIIGLLNYPLSKHYHEDFFYREFQEYIPLQAWRKLVTPDFQQRIDELTDAFKGRVAQRGEMLDFVRTVNKGYLSVQGNPGIGKSALIAQFFKDLRSEDFKGLHVIPYFIRRGTLQAQAEQMLGQLLKKTDELFQQGRSILAEGNGPWDLQAQLFEKWRQWGKQAEGKKLLFLIDGLDEGVEGGILSYLPRENFESIQFIYGSRPDGHPRLRDFLTELPIGYHRSIMLQGLSKQDIRALIYEVADKYAIGSQSDWIDRVLERSEGNPLYLKLLCDAIQNGSIGLNDMKALPKEIHAYYDAILNRYAEEREDGRELLRGLYVFVAAKDHLTFSQLAAINRVDEAALHRISSTLREVLVENPLTDDVLDYQIFHESFREYLLQRNSREVDEARERIIDYCAGWQLLKGSWDERYALLHYAGHLSESHKTERGNELLALMNNKVYMEEQKKVLRSFGALNDLCRKALKKASELKKKDDLLEAALSLVDFTYEEANDAPRVVDMVANGEIELALQRITSFGGNDEEGLRSKFILYMLCLMKLTLLDSRDKSFAREHIARLLQHLDENLPVDHSVLKWDDFFPSYFVFQMACRWAELELDHMIVYKRTYNWDASWVFEKGPFSEISLEVLIEAARGMRGKSEKSSTLGALSTELVKQGKVSDSDAIMLEAVETARGISDEREKSLALGTISTELVKQGKVLEALRMTRGISDKERKSSALGAISTELAKQGNVSNSDAIMLEALETGRGICDEQKKSVVIGEISTELAKQGKVSDSDAVMFEALKTARGISYETEKSSALANISTGLAKQGKVSESDAIMLESIETARKISVEWRKNLALKEISTELAKQGKVSKAIETAREISGEWEKSPALRAISTELAKQGKVSEADAVMLESHEAARGISDYWEKSRALRAISTELAKQGKVSDSNAVIFEALETARGISDDQKKSRTLGIISTELAKQGKLSEALETARGIGDDGAKSRALRTISTELAKQGKVSDSDAVMFEALETAREISFERRKNLVIEEISTELAKQGKVSEALETACEISDKERKNSALGTISTELAKQGKVLEALETAREISDEREKSLALGTISTELAKQGKVLEALETARRISNEREKSLALGTISTELAKQGKLSDSVAIMFEALDTARRISDEWEKSLALGTISTELAKQGKVLEALEMTRRISDEREKNLALGTISTELAKQGKVLEALETVRRISNEREKSLALGTISTELANQGKLSDSVTIMLEALETAREISDEREKSLALGTISTELAKQGKVSEALETACEISDKERKNLALKEISTELAKQGRLKQADEAALEIRSASEYCHCLYKIASILMDLNGITDSFSLVESFSTDEARLFYLRGWTRKLIPKDANEHLLQLALPQLVIDSFSIENLLQAHALHCTFFEQTDKKKLNRLNKSLNIQWAMDIADRFPKRLSKNLEDWIEEIPDEDDRDQIRLWARQVAKGKMSEADFSAQTARLRNQ